MRKIKLGLWDKNGKKIYEGAIVQLTREISSNHIVTTLMTETPVIVMRNKGQYRVKLGEFVSLNKLFNWGYDVEVVGKIHENTELGKNNHGI